MRTRHKCEMREGPHDPSGKKIADVGPLQHHRRARLCDDKTDKNTKANRPADFLSGDSSAEPNLGTKLREGDVATVVRYIRVHFRFPCFEELSQTYHEPRYVYDTARRYASQPSDCYRLADDH